MTITTPKSADAWSPDVVAFSPAEVIPEALILTTSTVSGKVEGDEPVLRVGFVKDDVASTYLEAEPIAESNPELDEVLVSTVKIAQLVALSREQWVQDGTANAIATSTSRAVINKANQMYLNGAAESADGPSLPGLIELAETKLDTPVGGSLDGLIDIISTLETIGATPTNIVLGTGAWASLRKLRTGEGSNQSILGAGVTDAQHLLLDLPVTVSRAMEPNSGLIIDRAAVASAVGDVQVANSEHVRFESDSVVLRTTWRIGWNLVHPNRIGAFTVDTGETDTPEA